MKFTIKATLVILACLGSIAGCASQEKRADDPKPEVTCQDIPGIGPKKATGFFKGWIREAGSVEGVRNASYVVFKNPNVIPTGIVYAMHGLCNSGFLDSSSYDQKDLGALIALMPDKAFVAPTYGESWPLVPHATSSHDETVEKFTRVLMPFIETKHGLTGPRWIIGHSMGGANAATLIATNSALFQKAVLTNPMIFDCDPFSWFNICGPGLMTGGAASGLLGFSHSFTHAQWEVGNPHYLLAHATMPIPPTFVSACKQDEFDLFRGTEIWVKGIALKKGYVVDWKPLSKCDHNTYPKPTTVEAFLRKP